MNATVLEYECAIAKEDFDRANAILPSISTAEYNEVANFLHSNDYVDYAYQIVQDPAMKFNYALELEDIESCRALLLNELNVEKERIYNSQRWRRLADCCILKGSIELAEECAVRSTDLSLLLLLYTCSGNKQGLRELAGTSAESDQWNIAFICYYLLQDVNACRKVLQDQQLLPQTAFFTLSHQPSLIQSVFKDWQDDLLRCHHIAAELIANPSTYSEFFPGYQEALQLEQSIQPLYEMDIQAGEYVKYKEMLETGLCFDELACVGETMSQEEVVQEEEIQEEIVQESADDMKEFEELEGEVEGDVDDIDIDDLEKEWE